jgi:hypothetical protein
VTRESRLKREFRDACKKLAASFPPSGVAALDARDTDQAAGSYDWHGFTLTLERVYETELHAQVVASATAEAHTLTRFGKARRPAGRITVDQFNAAWRLDRVDPRMAAWARQHSANLVRGITASTRQSVRDIIVRAYTNNVSWSDTAKVLRTVVGPNPAATAAIEKAIGVNRDAFVASGLSRYAADAKAMSIAEKATERAVRARATTIARTEMVNAGNEGLLQSLLQAQDAGLLPQDAHKMWIAADPCPICEELNGEMVPIGQEFHTGDMAPTAHPNCRCTIGYVDNPNKDGKPPVEEYEVPSMREMERLDQEKWGDYDKLMNPINGERGHKYDSLLFDQAGYSRPTQLVARSEFDQLEGTVLHRGVQESVRGKSPGAIIESWKTGERYVGEGIHSNGTYFGAKESLAQRYAGDNGATYSVKMKKDAKVFDWWDGASRLKLEKYQEANSGYHSNMHFFVENGYDAIKVAQPKHTGDYWIVLNRGATVTPK